MTKRTLQAVWVRIVAAGILALCGSVDVSAQPARQSGEGFEFRRNLAVIANPYCAITTYILTDFPEQASSTNDGAKRPVIVIDASTFKSNRPYALFLMAHECCHYTLGHIRRATEQAKPLGPQPFYYLRPQLKNMELEADACAVRTLKRVREFDAIDSARSKMLEFGTNETGAYYPTGVERADNIALIAAERKSD